MKKQGKRAVDNLFDFLEIIVMAMFVVVLVFTFVFRTVNVQGQSMQDTLFENDSLVISKLLYTPKQGDIVVVNSSVLDNRIIKRIIAVEGQKVEIDNSRL
ncbi:MAG: signal peptidase I [Ruminococcus sp.]